MVNRYSSCQSGQDKKASRFAAAQSIRRILSVLNQVAKAKYNNNRFPLGDKLLPLQRLILNFPRQLWLLSF